MKRVKLLRSVNGQHKTIREKNAKIKKYSACMCCTHLD
jgi:hypothetical protein